MKLPVNGWEGSVIVSVNDSHQCLHGTVQRMTVYILLTLVCTSSLSCPGRGGTFDLHQYPLCISSAGTR